MTRGQSFHSNAQPKLQLLKYIYPTCNQDWHDDVPDYKYISIFQSLLKQRILSAYVFSCLKFICSEKATKFCEIFTLLLSYVVPVKSKVKISQNFVVLLKIYELYLANLIELK